MPAAHRKQRKINMLHKALPVGLYIEGLKTLKDLQDLWDAVLPLGVTQLSVDVLTWFPPIPSNTASVPSANFVSDAVIPLDLLCKSLALRVLVPDGFNVHQPNFLSDHNRRVRLEKIIRGSFDMFSHQMDHCSLFALSGSRPVVFLPYAPNLIFAYAERIMSLVSYRPEMGRELISSDSKGCEQFWVHIPLSGFVHDEDPESENGDGDADRSDKNSIVAWKWWIDLKSAVNFSSQVGVALEMPADIPSVANLVELWCSEPVKTIVVPTSIFTSGNDGLPRLSLAHETVLRKFLQLANVQICFRPGGIADPAEIHQLEPYVTYIRSIYAEQFVEFAEPVDPGLFLPMDHVHENLDDAAYMQFDLDKRKYADYTDAVRQYILYAQGYPDVPDTFVIAVVGCGYGPLVTAVIEAAADCFAKVRIYAVEKNPLAVGALEENCKTVWSGSDVRVIAEDMRTWNVPEPLDILLSELLGAFGDNELSPECLAGPEKYVKKYGVSIPRSYTSYLCPISATKLYELLPQESQRYKEAVFAFDVDFYSILGKPQPVFKFSHPSSSNTTKDRYAFMKFTVVRPGMLHGFSGSFAAQLYQCTEPDLELLIEHSIVPGKQTKGLVTWKPLLFLLDTPCMVTEKDTIMLHFWRRSNEQHVWYEWALGLPVASLTHNLDGCVLRMPLSFAD